MPSFLGSKSNSKRRSHTPATNTSRSTTPQQSTLLSRLPLNASSPAVYYGNNVPRVNRSTEYLSASTGSSSGGPPPPPPYDLMVSRSGSPVPTPSTSWTSEMSMLADKIRDDATAISPTAFSASAVENLDRKSISQGMKLVAIAADEYEDGNETVALDIYLSGIDKILMALPNKTDPKTKFALREKLTSVEERVGILNMASQSRQKRLQEQALATWEEDDQEGEQGKKSLLNSLGLSRITTTISTITTIATSRVYSGDNLETASTSVLKRNGGDQEHIEVSQASIDRFKRFGQFVINTTVTCAILIKQSPLPDIAYFLFGYLVQILLWIDSQYHLAQKAQDLSVECVKLILKADEQYHLHEFASEAMYMLIAASLKAAVAYKETPGYRERIDQLQYYEDDEGPVLTTNQGASPPPPCPASSKSTSRLPWIWSRWH